MQNGYEIIVQYHRESDWHGYHVSNLIARIGYVKDGKVDGNHLFNYLFSDEGIKKAIIE